MDRIMTLDVCNCTHATVGYSN